MAARTNAMQVTSNSLVKTELLYAENATTDVLSALLLFQITALIAFLLLNTIRATAFANVQMVPQIRVNFVLRKSDRERSGLK